MRGLKAKDLAAVVDFIYHGEANIYQEDLDGFLALAEELQLKPNFTGDDEDTKKKTAPTETEIKAENRQPMRPLHEHKEKTEISLQVDSEKDMDSEHIAESYSILKCNNSSYEHVPADDQKI